jgi:hypothetical protein
MTAQVLDTTLDLADRARSRVLGVVGRRLRPLLLDRDRRVAFLGTTLVLLALALSTLAPLWMLALAPLVWGVPHLLADVRYLVVRQGLARHKTLLVAIAVAVIAATSGLGVRASLTVATAVALLQPAAWRRKLPILLALLTATGLAWRDGLLADVALAHGHNLLAIAFWLGWRKRAVWLQSLPLVAFTVGTLLVLTGWLAPTLHTMQPGLGVDDLAAGLAPFATPVWAERLVVFYAFAQAVHYVAWLHLIPHDDRTRPTPRSFRRSFQALRNDLGPWLLGGALLAAVALALLAAIDLTEARTRYFQLAFFHGHLELVLLPVLWLRGIRTAA